MLKHLYRLLWDIFQIKAQRGEHILIGRDDFLVASVSIVRVVSVEVFLKIGYGAVDGAGRRDAVLQLDIYKIEVLIIPVHVA